MTKEGLYHAICVFGAINTLWISWAVYWMNKRNKRDSKRLNKFLDNQPGHQHWN